MEDEELGGHGDNGLDERQKQVLHRRELADECSETDQDHGSGEVSPDDSKWPEL